MSSPTCRCRGCCRQSNFHDQDALRIGQCPEIEVRILQEQTEMSGVGEPGTPPSIPALANAVHDLTGRRVRELPLDRAVRFA